MTAQEIAGGRRAIVLISSGLLALALAVALLWLPARAHTLLLTRVQSLVGRPATAESVRVQLFPFELDVRGLRIAAARAGDPPWLEIPRVVVAPSLSWLWEGDVVLSRVRIEQPTLRLTTSSAPGAEVPLAPAAGFLQGLRIRRLTIEHGAIVLDDRRVPLELSLPEVSTHLGGGRGGALAGRIAFGPGTARFGTAPPLAVQAAFDVLMKRGDIRIDDGRARTSRSDVGFSGEIALAAKTRARLALVGDVDLAELDRHVLQTGFALSGAARYQGEVLVDGARIAMNGGLDGHGGSWKGAPVPHFAAKVAWDDAGVRVRELALEVMGGTARLDLDVPPAGGAAGVRGTLDHLDAEELFSRVFDIGRPGVAAAATGEVQVSWPRGRSREISGTVQLDLAPVTDHRTPVGGVVAWRAEQGTQTLTSIELRNTATQVTMSGRIGRDNRADIKVVGRSRDLAAADDLGLRLRRALGNAAGAPFALKGSGAFEGRWGGTLAAPIYEGRFTGSDVVYLGVAWGRVDWVGRASEKEMVFRSLVARKDASELWIDGRLSAGEYGRNDDLDLRARLVDWPAEDLVRSLEWPLAWSGPISGHAQIAGRRSAPRGAVTLSGGAGRFGPVLYDRLSLNALLEGDRTQVTRGELSLGGGAARFAGSLGVSGEYDGSLNATNVDLGTLVPPLRPEQPWGGRLSGSLTLRGTLSRPQLLAHVTAPRLFLGDESLGGVTAQLTGQGDGLIAVDARLRSPRTDLRIAGHMAADAPYWAELGVSGQRTSIDPLLRAVLPTATLPSMVGTGTLTLAGPFARPSDLRIQLALSEFEVLIPDYPVHNARPVRLDLAQGRLNLQELHLAGEGTNLVASGEAYLLQDGPLDLTIQGAADLRSLAAVTRRFRARGAARLDMDLRGTRDSPRLDGRLELQGAGVRARNFPHGFEDVHGRIDFTERAAELRDLVGRLGGGEVEVGGLASYGKDGLASLDLSLSGSQIALGYPAGLRSVSDAELRLFGDATSQWLTGGIDVRQAVWTRRYDVASELMSTETDDEAAIPFREGLHFDVRIKAPGTLKVDNNLGALDARADLRLAGTSDNPVLLGRAEVDRGRVYFQGNTYVIRRGRIDFANPSRLDPFFDIEAETRVSSYRVNLKMNGTLERVYPTLTSDPPLSAVQILNLLAGAEEQEVASLGRAQTDQADLAATGAATMAAGRLSEEVGLERQAERLFGLNRFSIDPSVLKGGITNPTARITLGKRLTRDLNVLYSQDLSGGQEYLLSVEYILPPVPRLGEMISVLFTRSEIGGLGFDVRVQRSR